MTYSAKNHRALPTPHMRILAQDLAAAPGTQADVITADEIVDGFVLRNQISHEAEVANVPTGPVLLQCLPEELRRVGATIFVMVFNTGTYLMHFGVPDYTVAKDGDSNTLAPNSVGWLIFRCVKVHDDGSTKMFDMLVASDV